MIAYQKKIFESSTTLNTDFDKFVQTYDGIESALPSKLLRLFGKDLWANYKLLAKFVEDTETGKYSDNIFNAEMTSLINDVRHQVFLTFRRLSKLNLIRDDGPCPMCFRACCNDNPRANSHIIADAAIRAVINSLDSRMDDSMQVFDGNHAINRMKGPSSVKWKMLCRKCECFVADSGEKKLTELLQMILPETNKQINVENAWWRFTIAATLLWRTMHIVGDFKTSSEDVAQMYPLYDELMIGMNLAREALARREEIASVYPSVVIHVSPDLHKDGSDNRGMNEGIYFSDKGDKVGYVNVQIWIFHVLGFFSKCSEDKLYSDGVACTGSKSTTWAIPAGADRRSPLLVQYEEAQLRSKSDAKRSDPCNKARNLHYQRQFKLNSDNMTTFKNQPSLPPAETDFVVFCENKTDDQINFQVRFYPLARLVHYIERFRSIDAYFYAGLNIIFEVTEDGEFSTTDSSIHLVLSEVIDPMRGIRSSCAAAMKKVSV
jgi:hypothetical protein